MTRTEIGEAIAMIVVIMAWWPFVLLGWRPPTYRLILYSVSAIVVIVIFVRRARRLHEALQHSRRIIEQQQKMKAGPPSPMRLDGPPSGGKPRPQGPSGPAGPRGVLSPGYGRRSPKPGGKASSADETAPAGESKAKADKPGGSEGKPEAG